MNWLTSPYGRKNLEAVTGTMLLAFLVEHFAANLLLLPSDPEPYRWYTNTLGHSIIVRGLEVGLFLLFAVHIGIGLIMRLHHRRMLAKNPRAKRPTDFATRFVGLTGIVILAFLVLHLWRFFIPNRITGVENFDLYNQAHLAFASVWYTGVYIISMTALALHLKHGIRSALFSFKFIKPRMVPRTRTVLTWVAVGTCAGLAYIALHLCIRSLTT